MSAILYHASKSRAFGYIFLLSCFPVFCSFAKKAKYLYLFKRDTTLLFTSNFYFNTATWKYTFHIHIPTKTTHVHKALPDHLGKEFHRLTFFEINKKVNNCNIRIICHTNISYYSY